MLRRDKTWFIFSLLIQINVINFDIVAAMVGYTSAISKRLREIDFNS